MNSDLNQTELTEEFQKGTIVDLHAHSSYAGGTGSLDLKVAVENMPKKGVKIVGTGDCLHPAWYKTLKEQLHDPDDLGLFTLKTGNDFESQTKFVFQTEIDFTAPIGLSRKRVHCVFLFPNFNAVEEAFAVFKKYEINNNLGRPFITNKKIEDVAEKINSLLDIDYLVEFFPAHVLVPLGIYGPNPSITFMSDFFGDASKRIHAFETGLSADPSIITLIPELDKLTLLSNSDAHSAALNRLGRELTSFDLNNMSYKDLIHAIRNNHVCYTAEFHPSEGRYFLTGHRGGIRGHKQNEYCVFSPDKAPKTMICPICGLTIDPGVIQRALELSKAQGSTREFGKSYGPKRNFYRMVPLVEILTKSLNVKTIESKNIKMLYDRIISKIGNECKLWTTKIPVLENTLLEIIPQNVAEKIIEVRKGNFCFDPPGFDGSYGELLIGKTSTYRGISDISESPKKQKTLDEFT